MVIKQYRINLTDDEIVIQREWLERLLEYAERTKN